MAFVNFLSSRLLCSAIMCYNVFYPPQALRSYQLEVTVPTRFHPKIIGRRGAVITKIRTDNDVQIQFPEKSERDGIIIITGYERNASAARDDILKIVTELVRRYTALTYLILLPINSLLYYCHTGLRFSVF